MQYAILVIATAFKKHFEYAPSHDYQKHTRDDFGKSQMIDR